MTDGRTSLIKAMEVNDMPMVDTLLGADKNQNFSDKNGFMYQMVELYQREDRGMSLHWLRYAYLQCFDDYGYFVFR